VTDEQLTNRRWGLLYFKLAVVVVVCIAVGGTLRSGWAKLGEQSWQWNLPWLFASGILYLFGLLPMAWYWRRTLSALGQPPDWFATLYAYFMGHLGKYVPGKALVVLIRVGLIRRSVTSIRLAVASVMLETLTMMAVGGAMAAALALFVLKIDAWLALVALAMAAVAGVPTLPPIARRLAGRPGVVNVKELERQASGEQQGNDAAAIKPTDAVAMQQGLTVRLLVSGWLAGAVCWTAMGLSLWATLRGIGVDDVSPTADLPLLVAAVSFAVVAGFLSFLPGGIVVRDVLLVELLAPACGAAQALVAAVLIRLIWLLSELAICGILKIVQRVRIPAAAPPPSPQS
jgi:hypothetical protein